MPGALASRGRCSSGVIMDGNRNGNVAAEIRKRILTLVRTSLEKNAILVEISPDSRLADIGLSSVDMVALMLKLEAEFELIIPESEITPENFQSVETIERVILDHPALHTSVAGA